MATITKSEAIQELGNRGELPPERQSAFDELKRRGEFGDIPGQEGIASTIVDVATTIGTGTAGFAAELGGRDCRLRFDAD